MVRAAPPQPAQCRMSACQQGAPHRLLAPPAQTVTHRPRPRPCPPSPHPLRALSSTLLAAVASLILSIMLACASAVFLAGTGPACASGVSSPAAADAATARSGGNDALAAPRRLLADGPGATVAPNPEPWPLPMTAAPAGSGNGSSNGASQAPNVAAPGASAEAAPSGGSYSPLRHGACTARNAGGVSGVWCYHSAGSCVLYCQAQPGGPHLVCTHVCQITSTRTRMQWRQAGCISGTCMLVPGQQHRVFCPSTPCAPLSPAPFRRLCRRRTLWGERRPLRDGVRKKRYHRWRRPDPCS
jgi:hypothetical protein